MGIRSALSVLMYILLLQYCVPSHAAVQGHVIDSSQNPIVGALVTFTDESNPENSFSGYTDEIGWYEIDLNPLSVHEDAPFPFSLGQNYPNPFNPATIIPFSLDMPSHVSLTIYNITGQKIATVIDNTMDAGNHTTGWNGMDDDGNHVSSGIYLYRLKAGKHTKTRKMLLLDGGRVPGGDMSSRPGVSYPTGTAKIDVETTYTVTITHNSMYPYEETGVTITDGQARDFIVSVIGVTFEINGVTFTTIPGGTFQMGDEVGDLGGSCRPVHTVTVSDFEMGIYEVTQWQYESVMNSNPSNFSGSNLPVEQVSWYDASKFCNRLSDVAGFDRCYDERTWICDFNKNGFRLPTEAEWEYASRGGNQLKYGTVDGTINKNNANYNTMVGSTTIVGSYPPNPFGLYDMCGNVWEWCNDWLDDNYYSVFSSVNPTGPNNGTQKIHRGGSWNEHTDGEHYCRSASRGHRPPDMNHHWVGFRVVRRPNGVIY